jgi:hypothetical protein
MVGIALGESPGFQSRPAHTELIEVAFRNDGRMLGMKVGEIQEARSRKDGIELGRSYFDAP